MTGLCTCSYKATPRQALTVSFIILYLLSLVLNALRFSGYAENRRNHSDRFAAAENVKVYESATT